MDWKWMDANLEGESDPYITQLLNEYPLTEAWLNEIKVNKSNYLSVRFPDGNRSIMFGTLLYSVKETMGQTSECDRFHYFISNDVLITLNIDSHTRSVLKFGEGQIMLQACTNPIEGMFVIMRTLLHYLHVGMDQFVSNLRILEESMRESNAQTILDRIFDSRFELLYWTNMFIPFQEIIVASKEAFSNTIVESTSYQRLNYRAERMEKLLNHYEKEIDTLISIDNAISGVKGNDIMKTLTIITALFTPATVIGAIWGMNFDNLPFTDFGWGLFLVMCLASLGTIVLYLWMKKKGWTGDLLDDNTNK